MKAGLDGFSRLFINCFEILVSFSVSGDRACSGSPETFFDLSSYLKTRSFFISLRIFIMKSDPSIFMPEYLLRKKWGKKLKKALGSDNRDRDRQISFIASMSEEVDAEILDEIFEEYRKELVLDEEEAEFFSPQELMEVPVQHPASLEFFEGLDSAEKDELFREYLSASSLRFAWIGYDFFRSTIMN